MANRASSERVSPVFETVFIEPNSFINPLNIKWTWGLLPQDIWGVTNIYLPNFLAGVLSEMLAEPPIAYNVWGFTKRPNQFILESFVNPTLSCPCQKSVCLSGIPYQIKKMQGHFSFVPIAIQKMPG